MKRDSKAKFASDLSQRDNSVGNYEQLSVSRTGKLKFGARSVKFRPESETELRLLCLRVRWNGTNFRGNVIPTRCVE